MTTHEIVKIIPQYMIGIGTMILAVVAMLQALRKARADVIDEKENKKIKQGFRIQAFQRMWKPFAILALNVIFLFTLNGEGVTKSFIFFCVLNGALFTVLLHGFIAYCWIFWISENLVLKGSEPVDADNPCNPLENPINQLDD